MPTIEEKNIAIAEMLQLQRVKDWQGVECFENNPSWYRRQWSNRFQDWLEIYTYRDSELEFHSNANWQFEAIDFIEELQNFIPGIKFDVKISRNQANFLDLNIQLQV